jgi:hypothetical protein
MHLSLVVTCAPLPTPPPELAFQAYLAGLVAFKLKNLGQVLWSASYHDLSACSLSGTHSMESSNSKAGLNQEGDISGETVVLLDDPLRQPIRTSRSFVEIVIKGSWFLIFVPLRLCGGRLERMLDRKDKSSTGGEGFEDLSNHARQLFDIVRSQGADDEVVGTGW